jgi:hypothetical protein
MMLLKLKLDKEEKYRFIPTYINSTTIDEYFKHIYNNDMNHYSQKMHVIYKKDILLKIDEKSYDSIDPISLHLNEESLFFKVFVEGKVFWAEAKYFENL